VAVIAGLAVSASIPQAHAESSEEAIQFVVDTSGSMAGEKLDSAIAAIQQTAAAIPDSTALGLRSYAGDCDQSAVPPLVPLAPGNDAQIDAAAAGLVAGGGTPTTAALGRGIEELAAYSTTGPKRLVLLTDGDTQCGISICDYVKQNLPSGITLRLFTVGLQVSDAAAGDLTCAAQFTGGSYISAQDPSDLANALTQATGSLPAAGQVVCPQPAGRTEDGWSYTARMTASEGLVIENARYGPRLAARLLSVPYLKIIGQSTPTWGHLSVTPDPNDVGMRSKLVKVGCSATTAKAIYQVSSLTTNRVFAVEQSYRFDSFDADGHYCEATEHAKCAKFWPTVSWALVDGPPPGPGFGMNVVQRFEFDPDGVGGVGASDIIGDRFSLGNLGVADLGSSGHLNREDALAEGSNSGPAIRNGATVAWDNWHQTGRDEVGLPSPRKPGCAECVHAHWSWFGTMSGFKLSGANYAACRSTTCWSDGEPLILDGSLQTASLGWAVARDGERQPRDWRTIVDPKRSNASKIDGKRLVMYWDAQTPASGSPTNGVTVNSITYPVGDSYWPQLTTYRHGGTGGVFIDPARAFRTVTRKPKTAQAVIQPDFPRAATPFAGSSSRVPAGYLLPVRITLDSSRTANNQGPYYLRVRSTGPKLLNPDSLVADTDGGTPWIRVYNDKLGKSGQPQITSDAQVLREYPARDNYMVALAVFDRPPTAADVSFRLDAAPDGDEGYVPSTGRW
jgi:hypothetical protein